MALLGVEDISASEIMRGPILIFEENTAYSAVAAKMEKTGAAALLMQGDSLGILLPEQLQEGLSDAAALSLTQNLKKNIIPIQATALVADLILLMEGLGEDGILLVEGERGPEGIIQPADVRLFLWEKLQETETMLHAVMKTVNEAITMIDKQNRVIAWNDKAQTLYGIKSEAILGEKIDRFFTNLVVTEARNSARTYRDAYHQPCRDTHVLINAAPLIKGEDVFGSVSSERDITEMVYLHRELTKASSQVRKLEKAMSKIGDRKDPFAKIIGKSKTLHDAVAMAKRVAVTNASVLIRGESGTGKELFAEAIHQESLRKDRPFIVINCGAIPAPLFESELFGYSGGAFTGADKKGKPGKFELAHHGTLFLDEVGELQLDMQVKLLRVLQNKVFYRVGGRNPVHTDVRIIAATNRDLEKMVNEGTFRKDLYYRLNVVSLDIPPLRVRREDIGELVTSFVNEFCALYGKEPLSIPSDVMTNFLNYSWPGNIRELRNVVERLVILSEEGIARKEQLPEELKSHKIIMRQEPSSNLIEETERTERQLILKVLEESEGNKSKAAKTMGIPRSTLYYKLRILDIKS